MDEKGIRNYAQIMKDYSLTNLEVSNSDGHIKIERNTAQVQSSAATSLEDISLFTPITSKTNVSSNSVIVKSPLVGMFYAAPAENAEPYVSLGDVVKKGQTLCIVEAMKLMNEIVSDNDGTIAEIYVTNGQAVESGTALFRIEVDQHE